jgi:hypothetical protein
LVIGGVNVVNGILIQARLRRGQTQTKEISAEQICVVVMKKMLITQLEIVGVTVFHWHSFQTLARQHVHLFVMVAHVVVIVRPIVQ